MSALMIISVSACSSSNFSVGSKIKTLRESETTSSTWQQVMDREIDSNNLSDWLEKDYKALAFFENDAMYDYESAEHFADKSFLAGKAKETLPDELSSRHISPKYKEEATSAYNSVMDALAQNKGKHYPKEMARLQVSYDCWLEQIEEDHQENHILKCKNMFYQALADMKGVKSSVVVYFEHDTFSLVPDEVQKLHAVISNHKVLRGEILIEGHTDTTGTDSYNLNLSEQRAQAVKNKLKSLDDGISNIKIKALGEQNPAISTMDDTPEPRNRRAFIHFR